MRIIDRIVARFTRDYRHPETTRVFYTGRTVAGPYMSPDTAITVPAAWACIRYLSQTVAVLPWHVMRTAENGGEVADKHPVDWLLYKRPNPEWSAFQFRETLTHWALRWGNGYAEIEHDTNGRPFALWPIHPDRVQVCRDPVTDRLYYNVGMPTGARVELDPDDMLHVRGFGEGAVGLNVMAYAAESIGWAKAAQLFGAAFFGNSATPAAVVIAKKSLNAGGLKELEKKFRETYGAGPGKSNRVAFLDQDMDYKQVTIEPNKAQFLETNQFLIEEVCRWFGVPPHKVQHLLRATFSNIEHQSIEVVTDSIVPWVKRWEEEADYKLFGDRNRQGFYTKMNLNALLRGDTQARATYYRELRNLGVLTANDILRLEEMPTIGEEGDKRVMQSAMTTLEMIGEAPPPAATPASAAPPNATPANNNADEPASPEDAAARERFMARLQVEAPANADQ